ncbi:hypothetical protein AX17_005478 [Amanita inopinata Kibby_2008]|nr:hypothetical protein AX17_005478 [Amanita inopinata Kibby_2008]
MPATSTTTTATTVPSSSTFSFKAPFPAPSSSTNDASSSPLSPSSALKHRRVSLALPSTPRVVQPWRFRDDTTLDSHSQQQQHSTASSSSEKRGKMRKISAGVGGDDDEHSLHLPVQEKKLRKKWTPEETQMLVDGCQRHGVGNWKTILSDPDLKFDNRSPVDLKDRFRTYFPDAYKQHYPNARTHLSSKVRSMLPDGTPLFEKTRSKKRRPFTEEEDRALKAGYEKHGTVWAAIVKDPIFQEQNRRSTDLRDRFRNAFPDLYQAAGYKPRNSARKKQLLQQQQKLQPMGNDPAPKASVRAATDDHLTMSSAGPVRSHRRSHTNQGLFRGGTKSVPQSTACSEDGDSSAGEDEGESGLKHPPTPVLVDNVSTGSSSKDKQNGSSMSSTLENAFIDDDDEMEMVTIDPLADPLFLPPPPLQSWTSSSGNTPAQSHHAWSASRASPASSLSADLMMSSSQSSPPYQQCGDRNVSMDIPTRNASSSNNDTSASSSSSSMIGNSAWGTQDWFSPNPRLDPSGGAESSSSASPFLDSNSGLFSPSSFSLLQNHHHLSQGVMDRYDLLPASLSATSLGSSGLSSSAAGGTGGMTSGGASGGGLGGGSWFHDFSSEVGACDTHSTFSDEMFPPPNGFRGFTHHSSYAGDLIFGSRTHQPPLQNWYSPLGLAFESMTTAATTANTDTNGGINEIPSSKRPVTPSNARMGELGLSGLSAAAQAAQVNGIHPMQLHTPLRGIDEIELAGITLNDRPETPAPPSQSSAAKSQSQSQPPMTNDPQTMVGGTSDRLDNDFEVDMDTMARLPRHHAMGHQQGQEHDGMSRQTGKQDRERSKRDEPQDRFSLDDLVDLSAHEDDEADGGETKHGPGHHQRQRYQKKWHLQERDKTEERFVRDASIELDLDLDLEDHSTPPATPVMQACSLNMRRASHHLLSSPNIPGRTGTGSGQHGRSVSVPPSEARSPAYTNLSRTSTSTSHQYHNHDGTLFSPRPFRHTQYGASSNMNFNANATTVVPHFLLSSSASASNESLMLDRPPLNQGLINSIGHMDDMPYDLPFLDLHYHGMPGSNHASASGGLNGMISAAGMLFDEPFGDLSSVLTNLTFSSSSSSVRQALDLAQSQDVGNAKHPSSLNHQQVINGKTDRKPAAPSNTGESVVGTSAVGIRKHQRGQSVTSVCPQDLMLCKDRVDNKRKRASWDGFDGVYG